MEGQIFFPPEHFQWWLQKWMSEGFKNEIVAENPLTFVHKSMQQPSGYKYLCISFCWVLYFFMNMHIGEKTSICSLLADYITFWSCTSLWSFRETWSFTSHMDIKKRRSWWIANKYNLYGQSVPKCFSPHFTLQMEWFLPIHLAWCPKTRRGKRSR